MIYILTGDIRNGKTTALLEWVSGRTDVDGLLCPDGDNGKRYFLKIESKKEFELEVESESEKTISIGPFKFLKSAFEEANKYLLDSNERRDFKYLIIDELGKLELKNEGFHEATKKLIPNFMFDANKHLILVVRKSLLEAVINHYKIKVYKLLTKENLKNL
ncbi:nucleoside-triphosphatase [Winogradskyella pulchriflava]|uniref:Nucleoside-triphosphatase n=1 Tax=Winogradskyella pulchriflava TaxID=1110688 RepID=A0ABV6Q438_9FLAO